MNVFRSTWRYIYGKVQKTRTLSNIKHKYNICKSKKNIVIFGTPNHGNLGDYAIYLAEKKLLQEYAPDYHIFDVNMAVFNSEIDYLSKLIGKKDLLILTGGGNLGNQYMDDENIRRKVISLFPKNRIVIFPQTMFFTADETGEQEKAITADVYNTHKDLWIAARDELSYREMQVMFTGKLFLLPDVVLTWGTLTAKQRKGALVVLRSDVESSINNEQRRYVVQLLMRTYEKVEKTDTVVKDIPIEDFDKNLQNKWEQFQKAELVITDRLHGMIFAAISQTPCLCIGNYNHKLRETFKWVKELGYIRFLSDWSEIDGMIAELRKKKDCIYHVESVNERYASFLKEILNG